MIHDYFRVTGAHDAVLDYAYLFSVALHDVNVQDFDTRWDEVLQSMTEFPSDIILESLYKLRTRESDQLKTVLELYDMEIYQNNSTSNYQRLKTMVKRSFNQKHRLRNVDARHGRIETGAVALKEEKVPVTSGKKKASLRKDTNAVSGMRATSVPKNQTTMSPHLPSLPFHQVEVCRGREVSEAKSNHGSILRQMCRYFLKGTGTRSPCEYWDPPECQFYKTETGCKAGVKRFFPHHKVDEQPNKKPKERLLHERRESDDKNALALV